MSLNFAEYSQKGNEFIKEVAQELGTPQDTNHAGRVLTAVLHGIRDTITPEESLHLISQLPMWIKAVYVDGWKLSKSPTRIRHMEDFVQTVRDNSGRTAGRDFGNDEETKANIEAVFRVLKTHVSEGEIDDIKSQLPEEMVSLWDA